MSTHSGKEKAITIQVSLCCEPVLQLIHLPFDIFVLLLKLVEEPSLKGIRWPVVNYKVSVKNCSINTTFSCNVDSSSCMNVLQHVGNKSSKFTSWSSLFHSISSPAQRNITIVSHAHKMQPLLLVLSTQHAD